MDRRGQGGGLHRNTVSYSGGLIMIISISLVLLFLLLSFGLKRPSPYIGIFTYMVFPGFLFMGFLIFLYGMFRESRRRRLLRTIEALPYPRMDLNDPVQRKRFTLVFAVAVLCVVLLAYLGYRTYRFTDSITFCGKLCHRVMKPEYTAYLYSPHARVLCVECHVGGGVSWYVKSKLSGVPQVFATVFNTYPRPISVPVKSLRPARETCDECHWPQKFYGAQLIQNPHFRYDEENTAEQISLLVKTGGGVPELGEKAGIHWHMIIENKVYFKATDRQLQRIPWVKVVLYDGSTVIYEDKSAKVSKEELDKLPTHLMDCMHCHNRPSHMFGPPGRSLDKAMEVGTISPQLPWIKKLAFDALVKNYGDPENAHGGIRKAIETYYDQNHPDIMENQRDKVEQAIEGVIAIYDRNVFPKMKVDWATYPDDIGHRNWPGCFRCHNGRHVNQAGKVLIKSCPTCHTIPRRGPLLPLGATSPAGTEVWHLLPLKGKHGKILCDRCHQVGHLPPLECASCHGIDTSAPMMTMECNECHIDEFEVEPLVDCTSCHDDATGLHSIGGHGDLTCTSCHKPHTWTVTTRDTCIDCHGGMTSHHAPTFCGECHRFT